MRRARQFAVMLLLISIGGMSFAAPAAYAEGFDQASASAVWGQALAFISPRALEPLSMAQMAIWGLGGITAIDPDLSVKLQSGQLRLYGPDQILLVVNAPAAGDAPGWGHACAVVADKAYSSSAALRQAGTQGIIRSFFDELFNHFDPYSRYEAPQEAQQDELTLQGAAGLGMSVLRRGHEVLIDQVAADGPADQAGLKPGFQVLAIDGIKAGMIGLDQLQADLAGPAGSTAQLRVRAPGDTAQTITLTRADIPRQSVIVVPRKSVLEIRIIGFDHGTADQFTSALAQGLGATPAPAGIVIDLRGNRGGLLREAVLTADTLLASGEVTSTAGRDPAANKVWRAEGGDIAAGLPVVVLVDGQTASAAEILSAALADNRRAVVVGSETLGKGLVQNMTGLVDGGELFITWSRVLAPLGWPLQGLGVLPQVCTALGDQALASQIAALDQGRNLMSAALAQSRQARAPMPLAEILAIRDQCPATVGGNADYQTAKDLIDDPSAYQAALIVKPGQLKPEKAQLVAAP